MSAMVFRFRRVNRRLSTSWFAPHCFHAFILFKELYGRPKAWQLNYARHSICSLHTECLWGPCQLKKRLFHVLDYHDDDKTVMRSSYLYHGKLYTGKTEFWCWTQSQRPTAMSRIRIPCLRQNINTLKACSQMAEILQTTFPYAFFLCENYLNLIPISVKPFPNDPIENYSPCFVFLYDIS